MNSTFSMISNPLGNNIQTTAGCYAKLASPYLFLACDVKPLKGPRRQISSCLSYMENKTFRFRKVSKNIEEFPLRFSKCDCVINIICRAKYFVAQVCCPTPISVPRSLVPLQASILCLYCLGVSTFVTDCIRLFSNHWKKKPLYLCCLPKENVSNLIFQFVTISTSLWQFYCILPPLKFIVANPCLIVH